MLGALGAVVATGVVGIPRAASAESAPRPAEGSLPSTELIAPLAAGSALGSWRIERVVPLQDGALSVILVGREGPSFQLDVCALDPAPDAMRGPARTERFEVFVANGGDGATGTHEDHGLCAMALAEVVRANEARVSRAGFLSLRERLARRAARVHTA
jgi:hypothetical protein